MTRPSARHPLDLFEGRKKELRRTRRRKEYGQRSVGFLIPPLQGEGPARTGPREARPDDRLRAGGGGGRRGAGGAARRGGRGGGGGFGAAAEKPPHPPLALLAVALPRKRGRD